MTDLTSVAYAKFIDLVCEGEIEGLDNGFQSVFYNGTPLQNSDLSYNFKGVTVVFQAGTQGQSYLPSFADVANEITVGVKVFHGTPLTKTITNPDVDDARVTISFPQLVQINDDGSYSGTTVEFLIELQSNGTGFTTIYHDTINGRTTAKYQREYIVSLTGSPPWDIRLTRVTADNTSIRLSNDLFWDSYDEVENVKLSYPNSAVVATSIDSSQFNSIPTRAYLMKLLRIQVPTNYDPVARTYAGIWDGTFKIAWSSNPAWCYYDLMTNSRYGLGKYIGAAQVDKWALYSIGQYCDGMVDDGRGGTEPRFTCNVYIQSLAEAFVVLQQMASIFRAMVFWANGMVSAAQDSPADPNYQYTAANVIDGKFSYAGASSKARHTVALVTWNNPANQYAQDVQYVEDLDGIAKWGVVSTQVVAFGCTSQGQAERVGRWILYSERLESEVITFAAGLEGTRGRPGQIIQVLDPVRAGKRFGGRLLAAAAASNGPSNSVTLANLSPSDYLQFVSIISYTGVLTGFQRYESVVSGLGPYPLPATPDGMVAMVFLDGRLLPTANYSLSVASFTLMGINPADYVRVAVVFTADGLASGFQRYEAAVSGAGPYPVGVAPDGVMTLVFLDGGVLPAANYSITGGNLTLVGLTTTSYLQLVVISTYGGTEVGSFTRYETAVSGLGPYTLPQVPDGGLAVVFLDGYLLPLTDTIYGTTVRLTLDAPVSMLAGSTYEVSLITPAGGIATYPVVPVGSSGDYSSVLLTTPLSPLPLPMTIWILSGTELVPQLFRVLSIVETAKNIYTISGVAHNPSKYAAIEGGLAIVPRNISFGATIPAAPTALTLAEAVGPSGSAYSLEINASWANVPGVAGYEVHYFVDSDNEIQLLNTRLSNAYIPLSKVGTYTVRVLSVDLLGKKSVPTTATAYFNGSTLVLQTPQKNSSGTTVGSIRSNWSGLTITYSALGGPPATATISVTAATLSGGSATTSYNASSISVTGTASTTITYYMWYSDPGFKGGTKTLNADTTGAGLTATDGAIYVGSVDVVYPAAGGGGGGGGNPGGGKCIAETCYLPLCPAAELAEGVPILCVSDGSMRSEKHPVMRAARSHQRCVRVLTKSGVLLTCTLDAPLRREDSAYVVAAEALDHIVATMQDGHIIWDRVISVVDVGVLPIVAVDAGSRCFWAGDIDGRYILHHNTKNIP